MTDPEFLDMPIQSHVLKAAPEQLAKKFVANIQNLGWLSLIEDHDGTNVIEETPGSNSVSRFQDYKVSWVEPNDEIGYALHLAGLGSELEDNDGGGAAFTTAFYKINLQENKLVQPAVIVPLDNKTALNVRTNAVRDAYSGSSDLAYAFSMAAKIKAAKLDSFREQPAVHPGVNFVMHLIDTERLSPLSHD